MRLGVVGTMVWDRIFSRDVRSGPVEEWGGITYALSALQAAVPADWTIVPIMKVGRDLRHRAFEFLHTLPNVDTETGIVLVDEPNNRVELRYHDSERRLERMTGGVPPWTWPEIAPLLRNIDVLYINFISGFELELETAQRLRVGFAGPIYADIHSLMLGIDSEGLRVPKPTPLWHEWMQCFDIAQVNEDELSLLAHFWGDPWRFAASIVGDELRLLAVTLGSRGAAYVAAPSFTGNPIDWRRTGLQAHKKLSTPGSIRSEKIAVHAPTTLHTPATLDRPATATSTATVPAEGGDPTGCGDVFGATFLTRLLLGDEVRAAMTEANRIASRNVAHRGATGLYHFLKGQIGAA